MGNPEMMDSVGQALARNRETTEKFKENVVHQLLAAQCLFSITTLKNHAVRFGICHEHFNPDEAVTELVKEGRVILCCIEHGPLYLSAKKE